MTLVEAALLGVVQGVFMFVPVSSTSHLVLTQHWLAGRGSGMPPPDSAEMILFDIVVHVGTLISILVIMRGPLISLLNGLVADLRHTWARQREAAGTRVPTGSLRIVVLGLLTVLVTGVLGLGVRAYGAGVFASPVAIAVTLAVTGVILWWTDMAKGLWRGVAQITPWVAVAIGVAQAAALLPGLSRSGLTIAMALALGVHRRLAAQYSFFVAIPTILAAVALQGFEVARAGASAWTIPTGAYALGFLVAAVVGAASLAAVLRLLYAARFRYFAVYVWVLAAVVLATGLGVPAPAWLDLTWAP